jgi:hypothetical protein
LKINAPTNLVFTVKDGPAAGKSFVAQGELGRGGMGVVYEVKDVDGNRYIAKHPKSTTEVISREVNLTQRGVQKIIAELEAAGYIEVKKEFIKLIDEFLLGDFGFKEKFIELYFSGGRGYHCHVKDPAVLCLDSGERREIVDYITGRDIYDSIVFHEQITSTIQIRGRNIPSSKSLKMPKPDEPGWKGRISVVLLKLLRNNDIFAQATLIIGERKDTSDSISKLRDLQTIWIPIWRFLWFSHHFPGPSFMTRPKEMGG